VLSDMKSELTLFISALDYPTQIKYDKRRDGTSRTT